MAEEEEEEDNNEKLAAARLRVDEEDREMRSEIQRQDRRTLGLFNNWNNPLYTEGILQRT